MDIKAIQQSITNPDNPIHGGAQLNGLTGVIAADEVEEGYIVVLYAGESPKPKCVDTSSNGIAVLDNDGNFVFRRYLQSESKLFPTDDQRAEFGRIRSMTKAGLDMLVGQLRRRVQEGTDHFVIITEKP